jgi:hypothetical protein
MPHDDVFTPHEKVALLAERLILESIYGEVATFTDPKDKGQFFEGVRAVFEAYFGGHLIYISRGPVWGMSPDNPRNR